jgi:molybdopterin-guanine dinucleotide biosynthesis protein
MSVDIGGETQRSDGHAAAMLAFGTLATQLNDALGRVRPALEPHAARLPDGTLAGLDVLLAEFARRRIRIALYGEVKAGKSTLLNAIAGAALSPVAFEPLTSIPVRVTYGERTAWRVGNRRLDSVAALERLMREQAFAGGAQEVVAETDLDLLELGGQVDLLDTPGVGSAAEFDAVSADALRSLDAVILVVRYPALFTQFTRHVMDGLQADIGKLFVVWNLDADCAELTPVERTRHAETLRANVAGAHDLFLVDARAGFRAMQADDGAGSVASGLTTLIAALRRFASSTGREVAALREAAKRAHRALAAAHDCLVERHASLDHLLKETRTLLMAVQARAEAEVRAARGRFGDCENALVRIREEAAATAAQLARECRRQLRRARRQWIRRGDYGALAAATATATAGYADAVASANQATEHAVHAAAAAFGTSVVGTPRSRTAPAVGPLAPEERIDRAARGRAQLLRRALWRNWYVPGLTTLDRTGIIEDVKAQAVWVNGVVQAARDAGRTTLASRLTDITQRADAELQQIKLETNFAANEAEFEQLSQHLPQVAAQVERARHIAAEARALF